MPADVCQVPKTLPGTSSIKEQMDGQAGNAPSFTEVGRRQQLLPAPQWRVGRRSGDSGPGPSPLPPPPPPTPVHGQPHQIFPERATVGPPDDRVFPRHPWGPDWSCLDGPAAGHRRGAPATPLGDLRGCSRSEGQKGRPRDTLGGLKGAAQVLPQRWTERAPPRHSSPRRSCRRGWRPSPLAKGTCRATPNASDPSATDPSARQKSPPSLSLFRRRTTFAPPPQ